jgi:polar amino acid transport system substrate-binding protein
LKRLLPLLGVAALVSVLAACGGSGGSGTPGTTSSSSAAPTLHSGKLVVGLDPPAVGFQVGTLRGNSVVNPSGFEVDLAVDIAKKLGISKANISWTHVPFATLFRPGNKPFDFAFEESTITTARARVVDFSAPYFNANQGVLLSKGAPTPKSLADLKSMSLCAQSTTTGLDYVQHQLHATNVHTYSSTAEAFSALQVGRCQAFVMDVPIIASQKKTKPSAYGAVAGQIETHEQYGAVLQKDSKLTSYVSKAINQLNSDGTIGTLQAKWFAIDFSKIPVLK